jgi:hypothetical protein
MDLLFAPAAPAVVKKTKGNKVVLGKDKNGTSGMSTPKSKNNSSRKHFDIMSSITGTGAAGTGGRRPSGSSSSVASPSSNRSTPTKSPPMSAPGTPPLPTKRRYNLEGEVDEDDPLYKEWWMSCFGDALQGAKNLVFKN